ncbi:MAG TPA: hypothetical protein VGL45_12935 [Bradyrhizobium sp.]|jgi:hypothetical protein
MTALAQALTRATGTDVDVGTLRTVVIFSLVGLIASVCMARYGLDFGPF